MKFRKITVLIGAALGMSLLSSDASAHWCDDLWVSSYNIVVRPETDTVTVPASGSANMKIFVQNNMGYQLTNFKLGAKLGSTAITPVAPTLQVANTLLPGQKAIWTLPISKSGGGSVKIEDLTFSVTFGNSGQSRCYPLTGGSPVMVVKTDKTLYPAKASGLSSPQSVCPESAQARDLQFQAMAEFEDINLGLDKLMNFYCSGRGSWGASDGVTLTYCKDASSTTCPTTKPSGGGSKYQYVHLWAAGELAARKASLGARTAVLRARLQCGVNDADLGFAGFAMFNLGYLGEDAGARTFIESQIASGSAEMAAMAKAALLLMGKAEDMTKYRKDVEGGLTATSDFVKATSAASLGIAAKLDSAVTGTLIPLVKWIEPSAASEDGKGMFAAHLLELVAWDRRGWVGNGGDSGPVSFYGEPGGSTGTGGAGAGGVVGSGGVTGGGGVVGSGGVVGVGGSSGNRDGSVGDARQGTGGLSLGGAIGTAGATGATTGKGGALGNGGVTGAAGTQGLGGVVVGAGGANTSTTTSVPVGGNSAGGTPGGNGGEAPVGTEATGGATDPTDTSSGCACNLGDRSHSSTLSLFGLAGLALAAFRRRRQ